MAKGDDNRSFDDLLRIAEEERKLSDQKKQDIYTIVSQATAFGISHFTQPISVDSIKQKYFKLMEVKENFFNQEVPKAIQEKYFVQSIDNKSLTLGIKDIINGVNYIINQQNEKSVKYFGFKIFKDGRQNLLTYDGKDFDITKAGNDEIKTIFYSNFDQLIAQLKYKIEEDKPVLVKAPQKRAFDKEIADNGQKRKKQSLDSLGKRPQAKKLKIYRGSEGCGPKRVYLVGDRSIYNPDKPNKAAETLSNGINPFQAPRRITLAEAFPPCALKDPTIQPLEQKVNGIS